MNAGRSDIMTDARLTSITLTSGQRRLGRRHPPRGVCDRLSTQRAQVGRRLGLGGHAPNWTRATRRPVRPVLEV